MKKTLLFFASLFVGLGASTAQTTALDFNRVDCNGTPRSLFTDLDAGKVVIMEWYMGPSCQPCKDAAREIEGLKSSLLQSHPGKVMSYTFGYVDIYTCTATKSWVSALGLTSIPMDSMAGQLSHYGGFSMPTIAVVAGADHKIIYIANTSNGGYTPGDTAAMRTAIKSFFSPAGINKLPAQVRDIAVYPSPAGADVNIRIELNKPATIRVQMLNIAGQVVIQLPGEKASGTFSRQISTEAIAPGDYMVRVIADGAVITRHLSIVK